VIAIAAQVAEGMEGIIGPFPRRPGVLAERAAKQVASPVAMSPPIVAG
jgi:hypothetical protein